MDGDLVFIHIFNTRQKLIPGLVKKISGIVSEHVSVKWTGNLKTLCVNVGQQ